MLKVEYVLGFYFTSGEYGPLVLLIRKTKPDWQAGKLNGIGGHVEIGETPAQAMTREFTEETGAIVNDWQPFLIMEFPQSRVHCYVRIGNVPLGLMTTTDEAIGWTSVDALPDIVLPNLRWLVPMAYEDIENPGPFGPAPKEPPTITFPSAI